MSMVIKLGELKPFLKGTKPLKVLNRCPNPSVCSLVRSTGQVLI